MMSKWTRSAPSGASMNASNCCPTGGGCSLNSIPGGGGTGGMNCENAAFTPVANSVRNLLWRSAFPPSMPAGVFISVTRTDTTGWSAVRSDSSICAIPSLWGRVRDWCRRRSHE